MSVYLFVVDGFGVWNDNDKSTFNILREKCDFIENNILFLYKIGLKEAIVGEGNLLKHKSMYAGSLEGHREIMGYISKETYDILSNSLSNDILNSIYKKTYINCVGNIQGRGCCIIPKYYSFLDSSSVIMYLGYDSTISIAFSEDSFNINDIITYSNILINELYQNNINIRKIILRQFDNAFSKVNKRKEIFRKVNFDESIRCLNFSSIIVNDKVQDILDLNCVQVVECNSDKDCMNFLSNSTEDGFYFFNFPDFDFFAHQGKYEKCAETIINFDNFIKSFWKKLKSNDYVIVTGDHGVKISNCSLSTSHILENVALLCIDKFGYYSFRGRKEGLDQVYNLIRDIQTDSLITDNYFKLC